MPHGQFSLQELHPGDSPHCPAQFKGQGSGAEPTHKVQEPKAVVSGTQQHPVTSSLLMLKLCPPPLPLHSFLSQHPVACQECDATQNGQVLQSLEHVELSPVDIHESQHCWGKKKKKNKKELMTETAFQSPTICHPQNNCTARPKHLVPISSLKLWMAALKTTHYHQGMKTSGSPFWKENVTLTACNQPSCGRVMDILQTLRAIKKRRILWISIGDNLTHL